MLNTLPAIVHEGKIQLLEPIDLREGTRVLVTVLPDEDAQFWLQASQSALAAVWDNDEDEVYAQLLEV